MVIAIIIIFERIRQYIYLFVASKRWLSSGSRMANFFSRGLSGTEFERLEAASYKISRMLQNACNITRDCNNEENMKSVEHRHDLKSVVAAYYEKKDAVEKIGGHRWVWRQMRSRSLYRKEGVNFSARLLAANIVQFFTIMCECFYLVFAA